MKQRSCRWFGSERPTRTCRLVNSQQMIKHNNNIITTRIKFTSAGQRLSPSSTPGKVDVDSSDKRTKEKIVHFPMYENGESLWQLHFCYSSLKLECIFSAPPPHTHKKKNNNNLASSTLLLLWHFQLKVQIHINTHIVSKHLATWSVHKINTSNCVSFSSINFSLYSFFIIICLSPCLFVFFFARGTRMTCTIAPQLQQHTD